MTKHGFTKCIATLCLGLVLTSSANPAEAAKKKPKFTTKNYATTANKLQLKNFGACSALAPASWTTDAKYPYYAADIFGPGKKSYAGWFVRTVNPALATSGSDALNGVPNVFDDPDPTTEVIGVTQFASGQLGYSGTFADTHKDLVNGGYTAKILKSSDAQAVVIYKNPPFPGDGLSYAYIAVARIAIVPASASYDTLLTTARMAATINCKVSVVPTSTTSAFSSPKKSQKKIDPTDENEYNATLGSGIAYDSGGTPYAVTLDQYTSNACNKGVGGVEVNVGNECRVLDWGNSNLGVGDTAK
jgi:hypothetical protein